MKSYGIRKRLQGKETHSRRIEWRNREIMGGFATHAIFGREVLEEMSDETLVSMIRRHLGVFGIGCQGPDLFLYNIAMLLSREEKNLGYRMHKEKSSRYFAWLMQTIWELEDIEAAEVGISYLYGALAHYTLDSMLHPYVYARIGFNAWEPRSGQATGGLHHWLESAIDAKMIANKLGALPSGYHAERVQKIDKAEKEILVRILSEAVSKSYHINLKKENVRAAICMMKVITKGFFAASSRQRGLLRKIEHPFLEDYGLSNFMVTDDMVSLARVMNRENEVWRNPWDKEIASDDSVWDIYDKAVAQYHIYCSTLEEVLIHYKRKWLKEKGTSSGMLYRKIRRSDWQGDGIQVYKEKSSDIMKQTPDMKNVIGLFPLSRDDENEKMQNRIFHVAKELGNLSYESGLPLSLESVLRWRSM